MVGGECADLNVNFLLFSQVEKRFFFLSVKSIQCFASGTVVKWWVRSCEVGVNLCLGCGWVTQH